MLRAARARAKLRNIPFDLRAEDIRIPKTCPVLGIPLRVSRTGRSGPNSPSLDRIVPERGYVRDNVVVVSMRANRLKNDATLVEIQKMAAFYSAFQ